MFVTQAFISSQKINFVFFVNQDLFFGLIHGKYWENARILSNKWNPFKTTNFLEDMIAKLQSWELRSTKMWLMCQKSNFEILIDGWLILSLWRCLGTFDRKLSRARTSLSHRSQVRQIRELRIPLLLILIFFLVKFRKIFLFLPGIV